MLFLNRGDKLFKVYIEKREYNSETDCEWVSDFVSVDAIKPDKVSEEEWDIIESIVLEMAKGNKSVVKDIKGTNCLVDLERIDKNIDWGILAESEHYYIRAEYEDAVIFSKPNSKRIVSVGDHYGDPEDAYIDPEEKFCITVGCGLIKYNLTEPFEGYMYDRNTSQWIEVGREGDIEWCDCIEEVTDSYIIVSCEGEDRRRFNLETLEKEDL